MQKFNGSLIRQFPSLVTGNAAAGVQVTVKIAGGNTLATLYAANNAAGAQLSNPLTTDSKGFYSFYAADGQYRLQFSNGYPALAVQLVDVDAIRNDFDALESSNTTFRSEQQSAYDAFVLSQGWDQVGTFAAGFTYASPNQVGQDADGNWWRWNGVLPKTVTAGTLPSSDANYKLAGDGVLRSDLAAPDSAVLVGGVEAGELAQRLAENELKLLDQNWFDVMQLTKTVNDKRILIQRGDGAFDNIFVFVNHKQNFYQRWELTRGGGAGDGFDNAVPTHTNGNMWMINGVENALVGPATNVNGSDAEMIKSGTFTISGNDVRLTSGYVEATVFGTVIYFTYVARNDAGIANIYIDGLLIDTLDQYNISAGGVATVVKLAEGLDNVNHVVRVEWTGTENPSSSNDIVRARTITGVGLQDYDSVNTFETFRAPMESGSLFFKITQAAAELAIQTTVGGSTVFSGAYHKYCYPKVANNQTIHIDGNIIDFDDLVAGELVLCKSLRLVQDLELSNVDTPIADITMQHFFSSDGCNVKYNLEWTASVDVSRSYQAMWPARAEIAVLGGNQGKYVADYDSAYINAFKKSFNVLTYNNTDNWISGFKSNNEVGADWPNPNYVGLYLWDRPTDFKVYLRKFSGQTQVGDVWVSDITFSIGHCPNPDKVLMLPVIPS